MTSQELFSPENIAALARNTDPDTSHAAAKSTNAGKLMGEIYAVMKWYGLDGCIADDVQASLPDVLSHSLTPRYRQMIERGMIELTGETRRGNSGRQQQLRRVLPRPWVRVVNERRINTTADMTPRDIADVLIKNAELEATIARVSAVRYRTGPFTATPGKLWTEKWVVDEALKQETDDG